MKRLLAALLLIGMIGCTSRERVVRFATFNASLNRDKPGQLVEDLSTRDNQQARNVAEIIQRVRPEVLLINEFDRDEQRRAPELFQQNYLSVSQNGAKPIEYPFRVYLPVNTGVSIGFDLDNDGQVVKEPGTRGYGNDCFGFGQFPGHYGMLLLSMYPLHSLDGFHTFQNFHWKEMPGAMLPVNADGSQWYSPQELEVLRLSSKSHWDVPLRIDKRVVHVLASHPTPPAFDGPEDRNGKRNHDEIRLWKDYLLRANYIVDDEGQSPRHSAAISFVIMGDMNADPADGSSVRGAIQQLLDHPEVNGIFAPTSDGAVEAAQQQGGANATHKGDPRCDTADFGDGDGGPGNLRVDYVLPSRDLSVRAGGVFWPASSDPLHRLVVMDPVATSDHRMVWLDVVVRNGN